MVVTIEPHPPDPSRNQRQYTININKDTRIFTTVTTCVFAVYRWIEDAYDFTRHIIHQKYHQFPNHNHRSNKAIVGVGIQWSQEPSTSTFPNLPAAATLQLCVGNRCLIYQLRHSRLAPENLYIFLNDTALTFASLLCPEELIKKLFNPDLFLSFDNLNLPVNLRSCLRRRNPPPGWDDEKSTVYTLARDFLDLDCRISVEDEQQVYEIDWEVQELSDDQIKYATVVAYVSFSLGIRASKSDRGLLYS